MFSKHGSLLSHSYSSSEVVGWLGGFEISLPTANAIVGALTELGKRNEYERWFNQSNLLVDNISTVGRLFGRFTNRKSEHLTV